MKAKQLFGNIIGILGAAGFTMSAVFPAMSTPATGAMISQQEIPVSATIDSYYEIELPAGIDGAGTLNLTRENNDYITNSTLTDTQGTFYGYTTVGMRGVIDSDEKVHVKLTCDNLVKTTDDSVTADTKLLNINDTTGTKIGSMWTASASDKETYKVTLSDTWSQGSSGITMDFVTADINETTYTKKYAMLRTNLEKNGTYEGTLVIDFTLTDL